MCVRADDPDKEGDFTVPNTSRAVLVTGCSSGIGHATADLLARAGWPVYATARRVDSMEDLAAHGARLLALDVTDEDSMREAVASVESDHGAVGVLINNAGYSQAGAIEEVPMDKVRAQFETNVFGLISLTQMVLPGMRRHGWGRVVNMSSVAGKLTFPGAGIYHASKHAVEAISDALRFEVRGFGIEVIVVEPGLVRTPFGEHAAETLDSEIVDEGPYADFHKAIARATVEAHEKGVLARMGGTAAHVAQLVRHAISTDKPKPRYRVDRTARVLMTQRRLMPDRAWDRFLQVRFPRPR